MPENLCQAKLGQKAFQQLGTEEGQSKAVPKGIPCAKQAQGPCRFPNKSCPARAAAKVQRNTDVSNLPFSEEVHAPLLPRSSRFWRGTPLLLLYPLLHKKSPPSSPPLPSFLFKTCLCFSCLLFMVAAEREQRGVEKHWCCGYRFPHSPAPPLLCSTEVCIEKW